MLAAREERAGEAAADLEALGGGQREHRLGEVGVELVEHRLAQPGRHAARHRLDDAAERVAVLPGLSMSAIISLRGAGVRAADDVRARRRARVTGAGIDRRPRCRATSLDPGDDLDAARAREELARHRAGRDARRRSRARWRGRRLASARMPYLAW